MDNNQMLNYLCSHVRMIAKNRAESAGYIGGPEEHHIHMEECKILDQIVEDAEENTK